LVDEEDPVTGLVVLLAAHQGCKEGVFGLVGLLEDPERDPREVVQVPAEFFAVCGQPPDCRADRHDPLDAVPASDPPEFEQPFDHLPGAVGRDVAVTGPAVVGDQATPHVGPPAEVGEQVEAETLSQKPIGIADQHAGGFGAGVDDGDLHRL
jgi:hypothetical protein